MKQQKIWALRTSPVRQSSPATSHSLLFLSGLERIQSSFTQKSLKEMPCRQIHCILRWLDYNAVGWSCFPQNKPHANYVRSCRQSVKGQSCSLRCLSDVCAVYTVYASAHSLTGWAFASLRVQTWVFCRFKTPHPLSETPRLRRQQHKGSPVLPALETG